MSDSPRKVPPLQEIVLPEAEGRARLKKATRRSFLGVAAAAGGVALAWRWLTSSPLVDDVRAPLRSALRFNERLSRAAFSRGRLAPTFPRERAQDPRANGTEGLDDEDFDPAAWRLAVDGLATGSANLGLADIQSLPKTEMVTELKCIEGWSTVVQWGGVRFADFATRFPPPTPSGRPFDLAARPQDVPEYVSMETPDGDYFVGLDSDSALHPQTLLAWEMNGEPLSEEHGAPLRLVIPVKYGIKNIKRIGRIEWQDRRPKDYWADRGYDWYAGH